MNNLKSCPFCGGVAKLIAPGYKYYSPCWCKCTRCGAEGPTKSSELEAEKGWNERTQDDVEHSPIIGGWISVKDRLPEDENECIVGIEGKWIEIGWFHSNKGTWIIDGESYVNGYVTHWMAIPDLPKEEV